METDEQYSLKVEASEVIKEIGFAVKFVKVSEKLKNTEENIHMNVETKEGDKFCVELSARGFRIIGKEFDTDSMAGDQSVYYETVYALLDSVSPGYRNTFGDALVEKLKGLQDRADDT